MPSIPKVGVGAAVAFWWNRDTIVRWRGARIWMGFGKRSERVYPQSGLAHGQGRLIVGRRGGAT